MVTRTGAPVRACKPQSTASMRRAGAAQSQTVELYSPATSEYVVTPVGHSVLRIHIVSRALRRRNAVEDAGHLYRASAHARTNQAADGRSSSSALVPARSSRGGLLSSCLRLRLLSPLLFQPLAPFPVFLSLPKGEFPRHGSALAGRGRARGCSDSRAAWRRGSGILPAEEADGR